MRIAMELGECFHASLSQQFWSLVFQTWFELDPPALAFEAAVPEQRSDHNLKTLVGKGTLHGYWAQVDPDSAGDSLLNLAVIERLQLTAPWRALTLARKLESGPGKTYLGSPEFPENEAQFMEEALEQVTGNWLFR